MGFPPVGVSRIQSMSCATQKRPTFQQLKAKLRFDGDRSLRSPRRMTLRTGQSLRTVTAALQEDETS